ncbi:hypothetical protein pb186bvf_006053 [Paramecium bursaria]
MIYKTIQKYSKYPKFRSNWVILFLNQKFSNIYYYSIPCAYNS